MDHLLTILASIALGVSLAACCGLRAFLPLFLLGMVGRFTGWVELGDAFGWLTSSGALLALGIGVVLEAAADKVPGLNHLLDALATPLRAVAGMLVTAAVVVDLPLWVVALLAIILGGGTALAMGIAKSGVRGGVTAATASTGTPAASLLEDIGCALTTVLAMAITMVAVVVAVVAVGLLWVVGREVWRRRRR